MVYGNYFTQALIWMKTKKKMTTLAAEDKYFAINLHSARKVSTEFFSGSYFPAFAPEYGDFSLNLRIQSKCGKMRTKKL